MVTLVVATSLLIGRLYLQTPKKGPPPPINLQERVYKLTKAMEIAADETVLDGHGATLEGNGSGVGLHIGSHSHVTVKNLKITGFATGLLAQSSPDLTLANVSVSNSAGGIRLEKVAGALIEALQIHGCSEAVHLAGCSKLILEKSDLSQNLQRGLDLSGCTSCIVQDNKLVGIGGDGIVVENESIHNEVMRNLAVHCKSAGIVVTATSTVPLADSDNTFQGNDVSWTVGGAGFSASWEAADKFLDNTAGFCQTGFLLTNVSRSTFKGNLAVGNSTFGLKDDAGTNNTYDDNVFVRENGGPRAVFLKGDAGKTSGLRLFQDTFVDYQMPLQIEDVSPLTLQSNSFPGVKSVDIADIADIKGKRPIALDNQIVEPKGSDFVSSAGAVAQIPTVYDKLGGVSVASTAPGEMEVVVEGSLSGAFQGEEEVIGRYKGELPFDLSFPPRFEMFVRMRVVGAKPTFLSFAAELGDNSMAKDMPADDSGNTLFTPALAVDGDRTSPDNCWKPPSEKAGEWWEVDLKTDHTINAFSVLPNPVAPNDFWSKFHIAVSSTGLFHGEETIAVTETDFSHKPGPERFYRIPPIVGRYIRVYGDVEQPGVALKQFGVYGTSR